MKKLISVLGSTGSIGLNSLEIISKKKKYFKPFIFSANKNYKLICNQIIKFKPLYFLINDKKIYKKISKKFKNNKVKIISDYKSINFKSKKSITISAIPGIAGLNPVLELIRYSEKILIANKEAIICGWNLIKKKAEKNKTKLIPVDSEHFSILKLLENQKFELIEKIYLTASGGPFLNLTPNQLKKSSLKDALKHPKWKMGKKISIDSATLMNKIFELLEAHKLFNIPYSKLDILIHPNSLVHAIIKLKNGLTKLLYHETSMKIPLANAIFDGNLKIDDFIEIKKNKTFQNLYFNKINKKIFPSINLKNKMIQYPSTGIIVNASNEVLVDQFLRKKIQFMDIIRILMNIMRDGNFIKFAVKKPKNIKEIYQIDEWARITTLSYIK